MEEIKIRKVLENYNRYKASIVRYKIELKNLLHIYMPNGTQVLSHTPLVHSNESSVEKTVIKIDEKKNEIESIIEKMNDKINILDAQLNTLTSYKKNIIKDYYIEKIGLIEMCRKYQKNTKGAIYYIIDEAIVEMQYNIDKGIEQLRLDFI